MKAGEIKPAKTQEAIENEEIENLSKKLEALINDPATPHEERLKAETNLKLIQLKPLQTKVREQVLARYNQNKIAL